MEFYVAIKKDKGLYLTGHDKIYCNANSENSLRRALKMMVFM